MSPISRRTLLSAALAAAVCRVVGAASRWLARPAATDGAPTSWFRFGTFNDAPQAWTAHNAGAHYSCGIAGAPDAASEVRLELHAGDQWPDDVATSAPVERSLVQAMLDTGSNTSQALPMRQEVWWAFSFLVEPGPPLSSLGASYAWLIFADIHSDYAASFAHAIPIQLELGLDDALMIAVHATTVDPDGRAHYVFHGEPMTRGAWRDLVLRLCMDPDNTSGRGAADVWLDGRQILAYRGAIGFTGDLPYPQYQIYRGNPAPRLIAHEALAIRYSNHQISTTKSLRERVFRPPKAPG